MSAARRMGRGGRGHTLPELLAVGAVLSVCVLLVGATQLGSHARLAGSYARALLGTIHEARHSALASGRPARVRLVPDGASYLAVAEVSPASAPSTWLAVSGGLAAPAGVFLCQVDAQTTLSPASPACPLAGETHVCVSPSGRISVTLAAACGGAPTGATLYVGTADGRRRYKIALFALTGLGRLVDSW